MVGVDLDAIDKLIDYLVKEGASGFYGTYFFLLSS